MNTVVSYWWKEDGTPELCEVEKIEADKEYTCYHENCKISKGDICYILKPKDKDNYILCEKCFEKSTKIRK